jgi:two-component system, cell cycle sensor histidine kinase and response regulator CckA
MRDAEDKNGAALRFLLLEDNADDAALVAAMLRRAGKRVEIDVVGDEAHYCAALGGTPPDVIVADYQLRGYNGMAALEEMQRRGLVVPFILVTGVLPDEVAAELTRKGVSDYILKDRLARLPEAVRRATAERRLRAERAQAERALRESHQEYQLLFQASPQPMFVFDRADLALLAANAAAEQLYGYGAGELLRMRLPDLVPPADVPALLRHLAESDAMITPEFGPVPHRHRDGSTLWVELHSSGTRFGARNAALVLVRNVSDRVKVEREYRLLFETSPQMMWVFDRATLAIIAVNDAVVSHYGYSPEEFGKLTLLDLHLPEEGAQLRAALAREPQLPLDKAAGVFRHRIKDGSVIDVEVHSNPIGFRGHAAELVLLYDVSERVRAQQAQKRVEAELQALIANSPHGIFRSAPDCDHFFSVNPALVRLLGYASAEEVLALSLARDVYRAPAERQRMLEAIRRDPHQAVQTEWKRKDGSALLVSLHVQISYRPDGSLQFDTVLEDQTERRTLEAELRQAQKMEAIGRLAGGIAHDFNNLLMVMRGFAELLSEGLAAGPERHNAEQILAAADRAARLVGQLLAFGRKQVLAPHVLNLNECVAEVGRLLPRVLGEHIEVVLRPAADLHAVKVDPLQIEQVLMNLGINARDAMPQGGRLEIETRNVRISPRDRRRHSDAIPGQYVALVVSDTGCGMDAETQQHIFEPFFTTKQGKGNGLGLATVYGIVKQSGGFLWVYSEVGRGTTFKLYFPVVEQPATALGGPPQAALPAAAGHETLLVVEDEPGVREAMTQYLRRRGYSVMGAGNGADALQLAGQFAGHIDLLITDVVMPGIGGPELARRLAAARPEMRVLYISGYTGSVLADKLATDANSAFLEKPFTWDAFSRKVREMLEQPPNAAAHVDEPEFALAR